MKAQVISRLLIAVGIGLAAQAQHGVSAQEATSSQSSAAPAALVLFFDSASSRIRPQDLAILDKASRAYSEGKPIVMILTGSSDRVGRAVHNLKLSQKRAIAVLNGLLERGIPGDRFQVLAKGETDLPNPTSPGVRDAQNRRVEITWR